MARCQSGIEKSLSYPKTVVRIYGVQSGAELSGIYSIISLTFVTLSMKEMQMLSDANDPGLETLAHGAGRRVA